MDSNEEQRKRSYWACMQLQIWRERGFAPQLHSTPDGWVLVLNTTKWGQAEPSKRSRVQMLRYHTAPCESPEAAIEAGMGVLQ